MRSVPARRHRGPQIAGAGVRLNDGAPSWNGDSRYRGVVGDARDQGCHVGRRRLDSRPRRPQGRRVEGGHRRVGQRVKAEFDALDLLFVNAGITREPGWNPA
jgi:hypothetical protein